MLSGRKTVGRAVTADVSSAGALESCLGAGFHQLLAVSSVAGAGAEDCASAGAGAPQAARENSIPHSKISARAC